MSACTGSGVELAEALAEYVHGRIRAELGFGHHDARDMRELLEAGLPRLALQLRLPGLPEPRRPGGAAASCWVPTGIGIELSDEDQLWPEQSTSAIVLHHPQARYFNV